MLCIRTGMPVFNACDAECDKEASLYDVISYILTTGRDYATNQETAASRAARAAFVNCFPEYVSHSFWKLQFIPEEMKKTILDWYYQAG